MRAYVPVCIPQLQRLFCSASRSVHPFTHPYHARHHWHTEEDVPCVQVDAARHRAVRLQLRLCDKDRCPPRALRHRLQLRLDRRQDCCGAALVAIQG